MKVRTLALGALVLTACGQAAAAPAPARISLGQPVEAYRGKTLCEAGEAVVWSCNAKTRTISVCASKELTATTGYIQYRAGNPGKVELTYPAAKVHPRGRFTAGFYPQGNTSLDFRNGGYAYSVVEQLRSDEDEVIVEDPAGKMVSHTICNGGGGLNFSPDEMTTLGVTPH
jgi:hypothetical protein